MIKRENIKFFDDLARSTDSYLNSGRTVLTDRNVFENTFSDIDKKLQFKSSDSVCDLGGGSGHLTLFLSKKCKRVVLTDGAPSAIESAKKKLKDFSNIDFEVFDMGDFPWPFEDSKFDKVVCYSVAHYLASHEEFKNVVGELIRITKPGGRILIGDIPLSEKYSQNMETRKGKPVANFFLNLKYHVKKYLTSLTYGLKKVNPSAVRGLSYTKAVIGETVSKFTNADFAFLEQDSKLPFSNSREDIMITKRDNQKV